MTTLKGTKRMWETVLVSLISAVCITYTALQAAKAILRYQPPWERDAMDTFPPSRSTWKSCDTCANFDSNMRREPCASCHPAMTGNATKPHWTPGADEMTRDPQHYNIGGDR